MKKKTKLLNKLLTIVLSLMMVFSSVLVSKTNIILAEVNEEEIPEIKEEDINSEELSPEVIVDQEATTEDENKNEGEASSDVVTTPDSEALTEGEENNNPEVVEEQQETEKPMMTVSSPKKSFGSVLWPYKINFYTVNEKGKYSLYKQVKTNNTSDKIAEVKYPENLLREGESFGGWFEELSIAGVWTIAENKWDFNQSIAQSAVITKGLNLIHEINLYAKVYTQSMDYDEIFDIKVHNTNGSHVKDGWSYYSYYKDENTLELAKLWLLAIDDFDPTRFVDSYDYVMYEDQICTKSFDSEDARNAFLSTYTNNTLNTKTNSYEVTSIFDANEDGEINDKDKDYSGQQCRKIDTDDGYYLSIGDYYSGTGFDRAIQDANEGDDLVLLHSLYVVKPIEIWGNVNLDLNGKTVLYNEKARKLDLLHFIDRNTRKSDIIIPKEITSTILVTNSNVTIKNGVIKNCSDKGRGIIDISYNEDYKLTLDNVEIIVDGVSNTNNYAVQSGYDLIDESGVVVSKSSGFVDVLSGKYHGYFLNTNDGRLVLHKGVKAEYDPRYYKGSTIDNGVTFEAHTQAWNDGTAQYPWVIDSEPQVNIVSGNTVVAEYRTLAEAVADTAKNNGKEIKLLKDINLNKELYATDGVLTLSSNSTYSINLNNYSITGSEINVTNGNVTFKGDGYVKAKLRVKESGVLNIAGGSYYSIYDDTTSKNSLHVTGGNFIDNLSKSFYDSENYECVENDVPTYKYSIIAKNLGDPITVTIDGTNYGFSTFTNAIKKINKVDGTDIKITLNQNITTNSTIKITKPMTIDLAGHTIVSKVDYDTSDFVGFSTIYVEIPNGKALNIISGTGAISTISNSSLANNVNNVYGIYVASGNINLEHINISISPNECLNEYGIYSVSKDTNISLSQSFVMLTNSNINVYDSVNAIRSEGNITIRNNSNIYAFGKASKVMGIYCNGDLEISDSMVYANSSAPSSNIYVVQSSKNVHIHNSDSYNGTNINATCASGAATNIYGIYQRYVSTGSVKTIKLEDNAAINVAADNGVANNSKVYAVYVEETTSRTDYTDVLLGKTSIRANSIHNRAVGVYSAGGYVYGGTINGDLHDGLFDQVPSGSNTPVNVHDDIYAEGFDNFAVITIMGGNESAGVDIQYGPIKTKYSQLTNAIILMKSTGDDTYCVRASSSTSGIDLISGYYYSDIDNRLMNGKVYCINGYYNRDVSLNAAKNNKCVKTSETDTNRICDYDHHTYEYTIEGSSCSLKVSASAEDEIALKIMITYDPMMLLNNETKSKYGIRITIDGINDGDAAAFMSGMTIKDYETTNPDQASGGVYSYICPIPVKMMSNNIKVEIVGFDEYGAVNHVYHSVSKYSVEKYYYNMLDTKIDRTEAVRNLAAASLNFGAAAQDYFNYFVDEDSDNIANRELAEYYNEDGDPYSLKADRNYSMANDKCKNLYNIEEIVEYKGHSLILEGKSALRFYFNLKEGKTISDIECFHYVYGSDPYDDSAELFEDPFDLDVHANPDKNSIDADYYVDINGIGLLNICDPYQIVINDNYSFVYSPIDYIIYSVGNVSDQKLVELMYAYYECYFMYYQYMDY